MKFNLLMMFLLLSFISCDSSDAPPLENNTTAACGEGKASFFSACLEVMDWKISLKSRVFPRAISLSINEKEIFNECGTVGIGSINRTTGFFPVVTLKGFFKIEDTQTINIAVKDCSTLAVSFQNAVQGVKHLVDSANKKYVFIEI